MSPAFKRRSISLETSRGRPRGWKAPLPPASPPTTPPATAPVNAATSGPVAIKAPTPGMASAEIPTNHPTIPPKTPPASAPRIASSFIEMFRVSDRLSGRITEMSDEGKSMFRSSVSIEFACGSDVARQYTVSIKPPAFFGLVQLGPGQKIRFPYVLLGGFVELFPA